MKQVVATLLISVTWVTTACATRQLNDRVAINGKTYGVFQIPMNGFWRYEDEEPDNRDLFAQFDANNSANWRGYLAKFSIANGRLYLDSIKGRIDGNEVADRDIIDKRFPVRAHWYTGSIFVSIGGFDALSKRFLYVIEFSIERGKVVATHYISFRQIPMTWNGLKQKTQASADTEP